MVLQTCWTIHTLTHQHDYWPTAGALRLRVLKASEIASCFPNWLCCISGAELVVPSPQRLLTQRGCLAGLGCTAPLCLHFITLEFLGDFEHVRCLFPSRDALPCYCALSCVHDKTIGGMKSCRPWSLTFASVSSILFSWKSPWIPCPFSKDHLWLPILAQSLLI